jgi:hypothetical protein
MAIKKIQCADPHCDGIIAHQISDKTFELKRLDQGVTMTGSNWSTMATCPKNPKHQASIVVTDGKVDASLLRYKEEGESEGGDTGNPDDQ